jgi:LPXTG-motif cell wall-anchored protein
MAKRKESVVVFEGEDKFIKPRSVSYDLKAGKSEYVGVTEEQPARPDPYGYTMGEFSMPDLNDPLFCEKVKDFINTRGNGKASADAVMSAYNAFNQYCKGNPTNNESSTTTETTTSTTTETSTKSTSGTTDNTTQPPNLTSPIATTFPSTLGMRPSASGGGGGSDVTKGKEKKNTLLYIILGIGILGAAAYYLTRKKK